VHAVAEAALESVTIEQRQKELEILFLAVMGRILPSIRFMPECCRNCSRSLMAMLRRSSFAP
jgi:hypothetical protein